MGVSRYEAFLCQYHMYGGISISKETQRCTKSVTMKKESNK